MRLTIDMAKPKNDWEPLEGPRHYDIKPDSVCYPGGIWLCFETTDGFKISIHHSVIQQVTIR